MVVNIFLLLVRELVTTPKTLLNITLFLVEHLVAELMENIILHLVLTQELLTLETITLLMENKLVIN